MYFALNRIIDTLIGIVVSLTINLIIWNKIFIFFISQSMIEKLDRIKIKYGLIEME
jgi:uncharacterized membrane protein YgaE (UPF0421/DUF939 family)